jgi:predicted phosphoribosyltransferase
MFTGRADAGRQLGRVLRERGMDVELVLALPRGGVPVARGVRAALGCPLVVCTISSSDTVRSEGQLAHASGTGTTKRSRVQAVQAQVAGGTSNEEQDEGLAAGDRPEGRFDDGPSLVDKHVLVVDDGVVTGSKQLAAVQVARESGTRRVSLAVPVGPPETINELDEIAHEVVCLEIQRPFGSIDEYYETEPSERPETVRVPLSQFSSIDR